MKNDKERLLDYTDEETYRDAGQGGFEIRTFIAIAAAAGGQGDLKFYTAELPIFAVGCTGYILAAIPLVALWPHFRGRVRTDLKAPAM